MPRSPQGRAWCLTLNNYTEQQRNKLIGLVEEQQLQYLILGKEIGESGTPHLQGYLELPRKKTLAGVKALLGINQIHLEKRAGTQTQAIDYCKKDGDYYENGERMQQGSRSDLTSLKTRLDNGESIQDLARDDETFSLIIRYRKGLEWYASLRSTPRRFKSTVWVFRGPTGCGKTSRVWRECDEERMPLWVWPGGEWFDGYSGHEAVLFDDFCGELGFRLLLRLLDRYPMQVPVKGSYVEWCPKKIYITSNKSPHEWYPDELDVAPLIRRIEHDIEYSEPAPENNPLAEFANE